MIDPAIPTFLVGDSASGITVTIKKRDGTVRDLTGATAITCLCRTTRGTFTLTGTLLVAANGTMTLSAPGAATGDGIPQNADEVLLCTGYPYWTISAATRYARTPVRFGLRKWS